jgi:hypothetical protein
MPIEFTDISNDDKWAGSDWTVTDPDDLAQHIARISLGQYRHVAKVLAATGASTSDPHATAFAGARSLLISTQKDPWHRDGWIFQAISWIAAHLQSNGELIAAPHMQHADKGFDGLHLHVDKKTNTITGAVICEEQATENPRDTIRDDVWPEFNEFETGAHDHRLVSEVTQLLETSPDLDPDSAIANVLWNKTRAYRVSITISDTHNSDVGRARLFKNYEDYVDDDVVRRRAETFYQEDIRGWIVDIVTQSLTALDELELANV